MESPRPYALWPRVTDLAALPPVHPTAALVASAGDVEMIPAPAPEGTEPSRGRYEANDRLATGAVSGPGQVAMHRLTDRVNAGAFNVVLGATFSSPVSFAAAVEFGEISGQVGFLAETDTSTAVFIETAESAFVVELDYIGRKVTTVAAADRETALKWLAALADLFVPYPPPVPDPPLPREYVDVRFWMQDPVYRDANSFWRTIKIHEWEDVQQNYSATPRAQLDKLMALEDTPSGGKLLLLHGPPGSGKTRAILTLISMWRDWCEASVVTDSDALFGDATYLNSIILGAARGSGAMLLVVEDGDEFINVKGRDSKGQSIGRLLNLGDGIVGQGINLLTLLSTNVDVDSLNPAITRNGRCLANINIGQLTAEEATAWASDHGFEREYDKPAMLADLYAAMNETENTAEV